MRKAKTAREVLLRSVSEAEFQAQVIEFATLNGWLVYHTHDSRHSPDGFPDLALVHAGRGQLLLVELKREGEQLKPAQVVWGQALGAVFVRSRDDAGVDPTGFVWPPAFIYAVWRPSDWDAIEKLLRR